MKQKFICLLLLIPLLTMKVSAQGLSVAREYGENLRQWTSTDNLRYRTNIEKICDGKKSTRIADDIAMDLARRNSQPQNVSYQLDSYLNWIEKAMMSGLNIECSDYKVVDRKDIEGSTAQETKYARKADKEYVSCRIQVKGSLSYDVYDLICMREGKITKVSRFEKRGNKVKVDFSDLVDEHSIEVSYGYSSHYPLNIAVSTNFSYFNIGVEYGQNFSSDPLSSVDHTNFAKSEISGKYFYLLATPGVYLRYASIDCGLGCVFTKYKYESVYTSYEEKKNTFMMKPKVTFHIPIPFGVSHRDERLYISPHVGYQYVPKYGKLNCWEVGIGVRFRFETY